jgi:hypothetical protein
MVVFVMFGGKKIPIKCKREPANDSCLGTLSIYVPAASTSLDLSFLALLLFIRNE